ncbi:Type 1 glutamine amidotransferase-like domain-containing protein [Gordonia sp. PDNC005]|uniref:Type 1 glutamine amidotransferase-like domain-containing protein n=1 Tax=unclassified Gordonia (in: high G+C Gram-positive bacteria) TaxID=2657482 RepID=UPI0019643D9B|nr:Type 1 glutamine amidotransferase-like domain-containing protein [Gordonia sp. PDNC005]QRY63699.1 Type 1 glutamine amidotransferase-like domain-containing protein [Gordonia sp. PDNC005]
MHLLLLSLGDGALTRFVAECVSKPASDVRIGVVAGAGRELLEDRGYTTVDDFGFGDVDAVYVGGGNTFRILADLQRSGMDLELSERVRAGLPYIGLSAGSVIVGPDIEPAGLLDDPTEAPDLACTAGFGLIDQVVVPHAGGMLPAYPSSLIAETLRIYGPRFPLLPVDDDQAVEIHDSTLRVIRSP